MGRKTPTKRVLFPRWLKLAGFGLFAALSISLAIIFAAAPTAYATTSNTVNFQARLMNASGSIVPDGTYNVEFKLYNTSSSSGSSQGSCTGDSHCLWDEDYLVGSSQGVSVSNGYLSVSLGSINPFSNATTAINWGQPLYLTINIGGTGSSPSWDGEMNPRIALTSVPAAFALESPNSGSFTSTLSFVQPTASEQILLPAESGATEYVCYQNDTACGFESTTGTNFIQNQNSSPQTANFNISGTGQLATLDATGSGTANTLTIGSTASTTGAINLGTSMTTGTVTIGGTATTGTITIGKYNGSGTSTINIGSNAGASTTQNVNIATSTTGTNAVTVGSTSSTSTTKLQAGATSETVNNSGVGINTTSTGAALTVNSGTSGLSGLQFTQLNSNSTGSTAYVGVLGVDASGNVGLTTITTPLIGQALAYWDGNNDPTTGNQAYPQATLTGNAVYSAGNGVQLTANVNNESGSMNWTFNQLPAERIQFNFKAGGGNGADATWFYAYADGVPTNENGAGITKGYEVGFSEYHKCVYLDYGNYGGSSGSAGSCSGTDGVNRLAQYALTTINDNNWHNVDISILYNQITVRWDGQVIINYTDVYTRDLSNPAYDHFGFGARTGGSNDNHYIKGLVVTKLGTNISEYGIATTTAIQNALYWNNSTDALGINAVNPGAQLQADTSSATTIGQIIQGYSGQSADLLELQNSSGGILSRFDSSGNLYLASTLDSQTSSGTLNVGGANSGTGTLNVGSGATTGAIAVGGTSQTGVVTIGQSTASNTISIGSANTATGNTQTINIGAGTDAGTGKAVVTVGNTNGASSLTLQAGTGGINISDTTGAVNLTGGAASTWSIGSSNALTITSSKFNVGGGAATLGSSSVAGSLVLQDGAGHTDTLSDTTLSTNQTVTLPNASGTVCLQTSTACGFESTTGTDFIQNQNAGTQTANFNISGSGVAGNFQATNYILTPNLDTPTATTLTIGPTNATAITLGSVGITTTDAGSLIVSGSTTANGIISQTTSLNTTGSITSVTVTNTNTTSTQALVGGISIHPIGTANSNSNANVLEGIFFNNVTTLANNSFYALNFGTGYNDLLRYNGTQIISGTGVLQSAGLSGTYSNALQLTNAGNTFTGSTYNNLTLTSASDGFTVQGGTTARKLTVTGADITLGSTIQPTNAGALTVESNGTNNLTLDTGGSGTVNIGTTNATGVNLGQSLTFTGTAARTITGPGSGGLSITDASGNLALSTTTSGTLSLSSAGAVTVTGAAASSVTTSSGALTLTSAAAATWGTSSGALTLTTGSGNIILDAAGSGTTANIQIGEGNGGSGSTTPDLLVLDDGSTSSDPTGGVPGAMYYNVALDQYRCYYATGWQDCADSPIDQSFQFTDDFIAGGLGAGTIGNIDWELQTIGSAPSNDGYNSGSVAALDPSASHPGTFKWSNNTTTFNSTGATVSLGASGATTAAPSMFTNSGMDIKSTVAVTSVASTGMIIRDGIDNETTGTARGTSGAFWEFDPGQDSGNWELCNGNNAAPVCVDSGVAAAANTWYRLEIQILSSTNVIGYVNGTKVTNTNAVDFTTNRVSPAMNCMSTATATAQNFCYVDYYQIRGDVSSPR